MTLSPAAQVCLREACYPVVKPTDDPTDLRWIARDYRDHADLEVELPADARDLLRDVATTLELGALLIELAPVLDALHPISAAAPTATDTGPGPEHPPAPAGATSILTGDARHVDGESAGAEGNEPPTAPAVNPPT